METKISEDRLAEQYFGFMHDLMSQLQVAFRQSGLQQKTVAERLGKAPESISRCLSGQQNMTIRTMHNIARAMGFRPEVRLVDVSSLPLTNKRPLRQEPTPSPSASSGDSIYSPKGDSSASPGATTFR